MDREVEWLRAVAPRTFEPPEPTLQRARDRLVAEFERAAPGHSDAELDLLPLGDLAELELLPAAPTRARDRHQRSNRRAVLIMVAAGIAILVAVSSTIGGGNRYDRTIETDSPDADLTGVQTQPLVRPPFEPPSRSDTPPGDLRGPTPSLIISKVFQLSDGQPVTITVFNVPEATSLDLELCPMNTAPEVGCPSLGTEPLNGSDRQSLPISIPRHTVDPTSGGVVDCVEPCTIRVRVGSVTAYARVSFKPDGELVDSPTLELDRRPDAPDDRIAVTGQGFPTYSSSGQYLQGQICENEPTELTNTLEVIAGCGFTDGEMWEREPKLDESGSFSAVLVAPEAVTTQPSEEIHRCFEESCWLVVSTGGLAAGAALASVQLS